MFFKSGSESVSQSVSEWVSDKGTYRAVRWQLKRQWQRQKAIRQDLWTPVNILFDITDSQDLQTILSFIVSKYCETPLQIWSQGVWFFSCDTWKRTEIQRFEMIWFDQIYYRKYNFSLTPKSSACAEKSKVYIIHISVTLNSIWNSCNMFDFYPLLSNSIWIEMNSSWLCCSYIWLEALTSITLSS